jgi:hypothetical protein
MRRTEGSRFAFREGADEELWATRDYFWALKAGILDDHSREGWRSFSDGYRHRLPVTQPEHPPADPARRVA